MSTLGTHSKKLREPHPGEYLKEMIDELGISQYRLAIAARLPHCRITGIIKGRQNITVVTAMKLARVFGQTAGYWLNLQRFYDVAKAKDEIGEELAAILPIVEKHDATSVAA